MDDSILTVCWTSRTLHSRPQIVIYFTFTIYMYWLRQRYMILTAIRLLY
jgi:hypothetical protein